MDQDINVLENVQDSLEVFMARVSMSFKNGIRFVAL
jgi:hypothetical protein